MSLPSLRFILFFLITALGWWFLPKKVKKPWLLLACYGFYWLAGGAFVLLLALETLLTWLLARAADRELRGRRGLWTALGVLCTLGTLFFFKYTRFFLEDVLHLSAGFLPEWALPAGISFFSFVMCGYLFDVQQGKYPAEKNLLDYALFAAFFPTLLAGPIERGNTLLSQLREPPSAGGEERRQGLLRFVWGAAKKLVAADTIGLYVDAAWSDPGAVSGGAMLCAVLLYSFQIYLDFSAYTDMAIGCGSMLGFRLTENFQAPYLSLSVKDFWKKWHISLTSWFREYLYFPLGGSRKGRWRTIVNILIVFSVSGLWHGAAITFLLWGLLNGLYQAAGMLTLPARKKLWRWLGMEEDGRLLAAIRCILTFLLISAAWIFFRAPSLALALQAAKHILLIVREGFGWASAFNLLPERQLILMLLSLLPFLWEDIRIALRRPRLPMPRNPFLFWGSILLICLLISVFGVYGLGYDAREFVYFQF